MKAITNTGAEASTSVNSQISFGKAVASVETDITEDKADELYKEFIAHRVKLELFQGAYQWFNFTEYKSWHTKNSWIGTRRHKANLAKLKKAIIQRLKDKSKEAQDE